jgi:hypothetical protein
MNHKVLIELEFDEVPEGKRVLDCDVHDYLEELIDDGSLDYTVTTGNNETYGVLNYRDHLGE